MPSNAAAHKSNLIVLRPQPAQAPKRDVSSGVVPRAVIRPELLSYRLLRPREAGPVDLPLLGEAYRCWSEVWTSTFRELDGKQLVPSDDFTRQDEIGAVFHGWECIGLTSYRWVDLSNPVYHDDSYFQVWPEGARESACAYGTRICVGSSLTVAAHWRNAADYSVKEMLLALAIERFLRSDADTMVGTMRNNRGMNSLGYRLGFRPLAHSVMHHGVDVDLVAFYRKTCERLPLSAQTEDVLRELLP